MNITSHAKDRRKRLGITKKSVNRMAEKAFKQGIKYFESAGKLKIYFEYLLLTHEQGNNIRIFNRNVYIFEDEVLITIFQLPKVYWDYADKQQKMNREVCV